MDTPTGDIDVETALYQNAVEVAVGDFRARLGLDRIEPVDTALNDGNYQDTVRELRRIVHARMICHTPSEAAALDRLAAETS